MASGCERGFVSARLRILNGHDCILPSVEVHTIGTGGGTIARVESGVMLRVGPRSAGADPGPACYGNGGLLPTVTDANLALGRLDPAHFAGGRLPLDPSKAAAAISDHLAKPMNTDVTRAADGTVTVANQNMTEAVRLMTVQRGYDPRDFTLVAAGGAAGLHVGSIVRELRMARGYIPRQAAYFCALGLLQSDIEREYLCSLFERLDRLRPDCLTEGFARLTEQAQADFVQAGMDSASADYRRYVAIRYTGHQHTIQVAVTGATEVQLSDLAVGFHRQHELLYGFSRPESKVEVVFLRLVAVIPTPAIDPRPLPAEMCEVEPSKWRNLYFVELGGATSTAFYTESQLRPGHKLSGPAVIEAESTTILALPGQTIEVDSYGNYSLSDDSVTKPAHGTATAG
ncbi:MAG: hydantoinase/oxoprolinase family protein [Chloroflexota bacterium]